MLQDYLQRLQAEGQLQALGREFSLDARAQSAKLARFQSQEPALWFLKVIQAAVACGAPDVSIRLLRERFEVSFTPPQPVANFDLNQSELPWARHLRMALVAALATSPPSMRLRWGEQLLYQQNSPQTYGGAEVCLWLKRLPRPFWKFVDQETLLIHAALAARAALAPIPVMLDGRCLNRVCLEQQPLSDGAARASFTEAAYSGYHWLAERSWFAPAGPHFALAPPAARSAFSTHTGSKDSVLNSWKEEHPVACFHWLESNETIQAVLAPVHHYLGVREQEQQVWGLPAPEWMLTRVPAAGRRCVYRSMACWRWLGLAACSSAPARLIYVHDGVLLDPLPIADGLPGTLAILADSDLSTDLSQLTVVENEKVAADRVWILEQQVELAHRCRAVVLSFSEAENRRLPISMRSHWRTVFRSISE